MRRLLTGFVVNGKKRRRDMPPNFAGFERAKNIGRLAESAPLMRKKDGGQGEKRA